MYSVSFIIFTHLDNLRPIKKFYKKNFLSTDKVKRKFTYRVTKISDINESIKIFLTILMLITLMAMVTIVITTITATVMTAPITIMQPMVM